MEPQETTQKDPLQTPAISQTTNIAAAIVTSVAMIAIALVIILHPGSKTTPNPANPTTQDTTASDAAPTTPTSIPVEIATLRSSDANYIRGDANTAQVLIFEYSDSDCPFCVRFHPTLQQIVSDYKGKVAWVYRFFPLESLHPDAYNEALALSCAGQLGGPKVFNNYLDSAINVTVNPDQKSNEIFTTFATQNGLDAAKFKSCMTSTATASAVQAGIDEANKIGAQGTPFSVIVNKATGKQVIIPGAYPISDVKKAIDSVL
ncbi:MAG: thioredoxin domain-containing protein [Candidatus Paceibacterota bacterium]